MTLLFEMLVLAVCSPLIVALIQALLFRLLPGKSPQGMTMVAMVLGYPAIFAIAILINGGLLPVAQCAYVFLLYSFAAYTYFHVFNMSETSRRIRLLRALAIAGTRDLKDVEAVFDERDMMQARLVRLVALGQIERVRNEYMPCGRTFAIAGMVLYQLSELFGTPWDSIRKWKRPAPPCIADK